MKNLGSLNLPGLMYRLLIAQSSRKEANFINGAPTKRTNLFNSHIVDE